MHFSASVFVLAESLADLSPRLFVHHSRRAVKEELKEGETKEGEEAIGCKGVNQCLCRLDACLSSLDKTHGVRGVSAKFECKALCRRCNLKVLETARNFQAYLIKPSGDEPMTACGRSNSRCDRETDEAT